MAVSLYDSPAQAQFINTYVPIEFESLYRIADKAREDIKVAEANEDEFIKNYSSINTPSTADKQMFEKLTAGVAGAVDQISSSLDGMKSADNRATLAREVRKLRRNPALAGIIYNAERLNEYVKNTDERWGGLEAEEAYNFSTVGPNGSVNSFNKRNLEYKTISELTNPYFEGMKETYLGKGRNSFEDVYGISEESIQNVSEGASDYLLGTEQGKLLMKQHLAENRQSAVKGLVESADGDIEYDGKRYKFDESKYMSSMVKDAQVHRVNKEYKLNQAAMSQAQLSIAQAKEARELAKAKADASGKFSYIAASKENLMSKVDNNARSLVLNYYSSLRSGNKGALNAAGTKFGAEGVEYYAQSNRYTAVQNDLNVARDKYNMALKDASMDPQERAVIKAQYESKAKHFTQVGQELQAATDRLDARISLELSEYGKNPKSSSFTPEDIRNISMTEADPNFINMNNVYKLGSKVGQVNVPGVGKFDAYTAHNTADMKPLTKSWNTISNVGANVAPAYNKLSSLLATNSLQDGATYASTTRVQSAGGNFASHGQIVIEASKLKSIISPNGESLSDADLANLERHGIIQRKSGVSLQLNVEYGSEDEDEPAEKQKKPETVNAYVINVSNPLISEESLSGMQMDNAASKTFGKIQL